MNTSLFTVCLLTFCLVVVSARFYPRRKRPLNDAPDFIREYYGLPACEPEGGECESSSQCCSPIATCSMAEDYKRRCFSPFDQADKRAIIWTNSVPYYSPWLFAVADSFKQFYIYPCLCIVIRLVSPVEVEKACSLITPCSFKNVISSKQASEFCNLWFNKHNTL